MMTPIMPKHVGYWRF